jgi:hypothetical protein
MTGEPRGAYGFRLDGVDGARRLLVSAPPEWPSLTLRVRLGFDEGGADRVDPDHASLRVHDGRVEIDRKRGEARFTVRRRPSPDALVHPHLAPVAAIAGRWIGRESFHAGAVVLGDGAWAVLGEKGSGKSSLLAWLALEGYRVLSDDLLIIDDRQQVLAGPRSIDLRTSAATRLGIGEPLGVIGTRERFRMAVGPVQSEVPLRGFIRLAWGDVPTVTPVPPAWRPAALAAQRTVRLAPRDPALLVELSALPMVELRRPREWGRAADAADQLLCALAG